MKRKYISVVYSQETQENIRNWAIDHGFDVKKSYSGRVLDEPMVYHSTVMYSTNTSRLEAQSYPMPSYKVMPTGMAWYAPNAPVIEINSPELSQLHLFWHNFGLRHTYPDFKPHISIAYDANGTLPTELPTFDLIFDQVVIEEIKEDW